MILRRSAYVAAGLSPPPYLAAATYLVAPPGRPGRGFTQGRKAVEAVLDSSPGLLWYSLQRELWGRTAWTLSVWESEAAMRAFVRAPAHTRAMELVPGVRESGGKFAHWTTEKPHVGWDEAYVQLGIEPPLGRILQPPPQPAPVGWSRP